MNAYSTSRRQMLRLGTAAAAALALPSLGRGDETKKKIPIAVQLYSVRNLLPVDFVGTIEGIGKMGYQGVEFAGYYGWDTRPKELRKLLDDNGLKCCGTHTHLPTLEGDQLKKTAELHTILGNKFLICPYLTAKDAAAWLDMAKKFNDISARAKELGMQVGYHSHQGDFKKFDGKTSWEIFFDNTVPEVIHQLDVGNTLDGGGDPLAMLKKYPGRTKSTHLKERGGPPQAALGEGTVDWKTMLETYETIGGTEWYIVEYEKDNPMENIRRSLHYLHSMGR